MAYVFDPETRKVTISAGDTMDLGVRTNGKYDAVIFAVYDRAAKQDLLTVPAQIEGGTAHIRLANRHTRDLPEGRYKWNLRMVSDPEYDENGNVIADEDSDNVMTVFGPENADIPDFVIRRTGAYV
jgi:hypothetical protein